MNKEDKVLLLKTKKETLESNLNPKIALVIAFLVLTTSVCATVILKFNQTLMSLLTTLFYLLLLLIFLPKPIKAINYDIEVIKKIDKSIYDLVKGNDVIESFIDTLYLESF